MSESRRYIQNSRGVRVVAWVRAKDVMTSLSCSQAFAYELLREAAGRNHGERGLLRVSVEDWERFVAQRFGSKAKVKSRRHFVPASGTFPAAARPQQAAVAPPVRLTQPRPKKKLEEEG